MFAESTASASTGTHQSDRIFENFKCVKHNDNFDGQLVPSDGSCFFAALAHQLYLPMQSKSTSRKELVEFIRTNEERMVRVHSKISELLGLWPRAFTSDLLDFNVTSCFNSCILYLHLNFSVVSAEFSLTFRDLSRLLTNKIFVCHSVLRSSTEALMIFGNNPTRMAF